LKLFFISFSFTAQPQPRRLAAAAAARSLCSFLNKMMVLPLVALLSVSAPKVQIEEFFSTA
jgi:hypothetical protein